MKELNDRESTERVGAGIACVLSIVVGIGLGYWAVSLDPSGNGASVRIMPVTITMLMLCIAFFVTGLVTHKTIGWGLVFGAGLLPFVFLVSANILRALLY